MTIGSRASLTPCPAISASASAVPASSHSCGCAIRVKTSRSRWCSGSPRSPMTRTFARMGLIVAPHGPPRTVDRAKLPVEDRAHGRDVEDTLNVRGAGDEGKGLPVALGGVASADKCAEAAGIHEGDLLQVDDDPLDACAARVPLHFAFDRVSGRDVEITSEADDDLS